MTPPAAAQQWHDGRYQQQHGHGITGNNVMAMVTQWAAVRHGKIHDMTGSSAPRRNGDTMGSSAPRHNSATAT